MKSFGPSTGTLRDRTETSGRGPMLRLCVPPVGGQGEVPSTLDLRSVESMPLEYTGVRVRNLERATRFFSEGLGLKVGPAGRMAAGGLWQELHDPETKVILELNYYPGDPPYHRGDELDHLGFRVTDLDAVVKRLVTLGARLEIPPFEEGEMRLAFLSDPDGLWVELYERRADEVPPTSRPGS